MTNSIQNCIQNSIQISIQNSQRINNSQHKDSPFENEIKESDKMNNKDYLYVDRISGLKVDDKVNKSRNKVNRN